MSTLQTVLFLLLDVAIACLAFGVLFSLIVKPTTRRVRKMSNYQTMDAITMAAMEHEMEERIERATRRAYHRGREAERDRITNLLMSPPQQNMVGYIHSTFSLDDPEFGFNK
jgi:hypothetical protein